MLEYDCLSCVVVVSRSLLLAMLFLSVLLLLFLFAFELAPLFVLRLFVVCVCRVCDVLFVCC